MELKNKLGRSSNAFIFILVAAVVLIIGGMYLQKNYPVFSTLPIGQDTCSPDGVLITNVNPYNSPWTSFRTQYAWVSIDVNGDGIREHFGINTPSTISSSCSASSATASLPVIFSTSNYEMRYNPHPSTNLEVPGRLYICGINPANGLSYTYLEQDKNQAANAMDTCLNNVGPCNPGARVCDFSESNIRYKVCQTTGTWSGALTCSEGQTCSNTPNPGTCSSQSVCDYTYSSYGACINGVQTRSVLSSSPSGCTGTPVLTQPCTVTCSPNWVCGAWSPTICPVSGLQTRTCIDANSCGLINPNSIAQSCQYINPDSGTNTNTNTGTGTTNTGTGANADTGTLVCTAKQISLLNTCVNTSLLWIIGLVFAGIIILVVVTKK